MSHLRRNSRDHVLRQLTIVAVVFAIVASLLVNPEARAAGTGSVSLTALGTPATESFDTLATTGTANTTLPTGWYLSESGTSTRNNDAYAADPGTSNTGDVYSYGAANSAERAFGGLRSGTLVPIVGASFANNTGSTVTSLVVSYTGEQWRAGVASRNAADRLDFQYSTDATSLTTGTWTNLDSLDFNSPNINVAAGALDGNAAANQTAVSTSISGLSIASGATVWIRWTDFDISSSDDGLAIDAFSITPQGTVGDSAPGVISTTPATGAMGVAADTNITVTFSEPVNVTGNAFTLECPAGTPVAFINTTAPPASNFVLDPSANLPFATSCTGTVIAAEVTDVDANDPPDTMAASYVFSFTTADPPPPEVRIRDVQGAGHVSPLVPTVSDNAISYSTSKVTVVGGIVTAVSGTGFWIQDPAPDADEATSEGLFAFTGSSGARPNVGDQVSVTGYAAEFRSGCTSGSCTSTSSAWANLTLTELSGRSGDPLSWARISAGNTLPAATVIGQGGRVPPATVIDDDTGGNIEAGPTTFDPASDGIDFYESLEGMLVQVNSPVAVSPTTSNGEIYALPDNGAGAVGVRTPRGGILPAPDYSDFNPEIVQFDDVLVTAEPQVIVGDRFDGAVVGVLDYNFAFYEILNTSALPAVISGGTAREAVTFPAPAFHELNVSSFNVENLAGNEGDAKYQDLANIVVNHLSSPDILGVEEIQDNNGTTNDSVVDASTTYQRLIDAIVAAGGPTYEYRQINPVDDQDGGAPGGNIRVGFLFRTDRGLAFVDRPGGDSTTAVSVVANGGQPELSFSPGRIDPTNSAFDASRKPLAGEFTFQGETIFVVVNHFNSKGGDNPLFGRFQPPVRVTEAQRHQQAALVNDFVDDVLAIDADAKVFVIGDINDFEFSETLSILKGEDGALVSLFTTLAQSERYTYVFNGNSQVLDHILASPGAFERLVGYDVVHVNSEFPDQISDHDPSVARFSLDGIAPETIITNLDDIPAVTAYNLVFEFTGSDNLTAPENLTFECRIDQGAFIGWAPCTSPYDTNGNYVDTNGNPLPILPGFHSFEVRAIDEAGNVDPSPATATWEARPLCGFDEATIYVDWQGLVHGGPQNGQPYAWPFELNGTAGRDVIFGSPEGERINAGGGNDVVCAGAGDDAVYGGAGSDTIYGMDGADTLNGEGGADTLNGGVLGDTLNGGPGADNLNGFLGNDTLNGGGDNDTLVGGPRLLPEPTMVDQDILNGEGGNDTLTGGAQGDKFSGGAGTDRATDFNKGQGDTTDGT